MASHGERRRYLVRRLCFAFVFAVSILSSRALAQVSPEPLVDEGFGIDAYVGVVLGSSREIGMAGAQAGIAEGLEGVTRNPAALAERGDADLGFYDWRMQLSFSNAGSFGRNAIYPGAGFDASTGIFSASFGLQFQWGPVGVGALMRLLRYTVDTDSGAFEVSMPQAYAGGALSIMQGEWLLGGGVRIQDMEVGFAGGTVKFTGASPTVGLLWRPFRRRFRVGLSGSRAVTSKLDNDQAVAMDPSFALPEQVSMPMEVRVGFAYRFSDSPMNYRHVNYRWLRREAESRVRDESCARIVERALAAGIQGRCRALRRAYADRDWMVLEEQRRADELERAEAGLEAERERRLARRRATQGRYHLLSLEAAVVGRSPDAIAVGSFMRQESVRAGDKVVTELRIGYESELWMERLRSRLGIYLEPSRVEGQSYRAHGTGSLELRLFHWDWLGRSLALASSMDLSAGWMNFSVGVSFW